MKTKNLIQKSLVAILSATLLFTACKKDENTDDNQVDSSSLQQLSKDDNDIVNASDDVMNDANDVLSRTSNKSINGLPCNATIDSTIVNNDTIIYNITYNGLSCNGKKNRTGNAKVKKHINAKWRDAGTVITVELINLKVTKVATNKSMTLNGVKYFKNVSGGLVRDLGTLSTSVVHQVSGNIQATFDDNTTKTWSIARQRTYTGTPDNLVLTIDGFGSANGYSNLVTWGTNRHNESFYTSITQSIVVKQSCDWNPVSGSKIHMVPADNKNAALTFGFDSNNNPISNNDCPTKYRLDWAKGNRSGTVFLSL